MEEYRYTTNNEWENASHPTDEDGKQHHIQCSKGDVARYCLLPGDPKQVGKIIRTWDSGHLVADYGEHTTYMGKTRDMGISACSIGAGGGSATSVLEDLAEIGYDILIRMGTCGVIQTYIKLGDLIICIGVVGKKGTNGGYTTNSYPAVAGHEVTVALIEAAKQLGYTYHVGVGYTVSSPFCGQGRPEYNRYSQSFTEALLPDTQVAGVLSLEMEATIVLAINSLYKIHVGAIFTVVVNRVGNSFQYDNNTMDHNLEVVNLAMQLLWE